jgi:hypothetical protein
MQGWCEKANVMCGQRDTTEISYPSFTDLFYELLQTHKRFVQETDIVDVSILVEWTQF